MLYGWDGASYQGRPNVALLKREGHEFVIEKVTGEGQYVNPYWSLVRQDARAAGVLFGSYDWITPQEWAGPADAQAAARDYLRVLGERQQGELICVDFEDPAWASGPYKHFIEAPMQTYLYTLKEESGQPVIVYTAPYFLAETGAANWAWLAKDFLYWIAAPGPQAMLPDDAPWPGGALVSPWSAALLHQHQWHATSAAVAGEFDRNRFRGTRAELAAYGKPGAARPQEDEVIEPAEGKYTAYINKAGNPIFVWNAGGTTPRIDGINVQDLGLSVESATEPGVILDRSIVANEVKPYHDRRQDARATQQPVGGIAVVE